MLFKGPFLHKVWDLVVFLCPIGQCWFGWFYLFLFFFSSFVKALAKIADVFVSVPLSVIYRILFNFPKKKKKGYVLHVFRKALFNLWWGSDVLKFLNSDTIRSFIGGWWKSILPGQEKTSNDLRFCWFLCAVSCVGFVCSTVKAGTRIPQFTHKPGSCSVPLPAAALSGVFFFLFTPFSVLTVISSLNLPFQHAQSKDIFPHV